MATSWLIKDGVGCSSCGAIALSSLLGAGAATSFTASLPLGGQELSIASVAVLTAILLSTLRKASRPVVCAVEPPRSRVGNRPRRSAAADLAAS